MGDLGTAKYEKGAIFIALYETAAGFRFSIWYSPPAEPLQFCHTPDGISCRLRFCRGLHTARYWIAYTIHKVLLRKVQCCGNVNYMPHFLSAASILPVYRRIRDSKVRSAYGKCTAAKYDLTEFSVTSAMQETIFLQAAGLYRSNKGCPACSFFLVFAKYD